MYLECCFDCSLFRARCESYTWQWRLNLKHWKINLKICGKNEDEWWVTSSEWGWLFFLSSTPQKPKLLSPAPICWLSCCWKNPNLNPGPLFALLIRLKKVSLSPLYISPPSLYIPPPLPPREGEISPNAYISSSYLIRKPAWFLRRLLSDVAWPWLSSRNENLYHSSQAKLPSLSLYHYH